MSQPNVDTLEQICRNTFCLDFEIPPLEVRAPETSSHNAVGAYPIEEDVPGTNTLLKLPPELRLIIYSHVFSTVSVAPTATISQFPLLQTCQLIRHEAKEVYFKRLETIAKEARERHEMVCERFEEGVDMGKWARAYVERSRMRRDDVLRLVGEMREVTEGKREEEGKGLEARWLSKVVVYGVVVVVGAVLAHLIVD